MLLDSSILYSTKYGMFFLKKIYYSMWLISYSTNYSMKFILYSTNYSMWLFTLYLTKDVITLAQLRDYNNSTLRVFIIYIVLSVSNDDIHGLNPPTSNYRYNMCIYIYIYAKKKKKIPVLRLCFFFFFNYRKNVWLL